MNKYPEEIEARAQKIIERDARYYGGSYGVTFMGERMFALNPRALKVKVMKQMMKEGTVA
jgi:hypothetical protein